MKLAASLVGCVGAMRLERELRSEEYVGFCPVGLHRREWYAQQDLPYIKSVLADLGV